MAEQHGMQPEHHVHQSEREFFDRARERLDRSLRHIAEIEKRLDAKVRRKDR